MSDFDFSNPQHRKARTYHTRALAAKMFAESPTHWSNSDTWAYIAEAWSDLARIKQSFIEEPVPHWPRSGPQPQDNRYLGTLGSQPRLR